MFQLIINLWPLWLLLGALGAINLIVDVVIPRFERRKRYDSQSKWRSNQALIKSLQMLKPYEFEEYTARLFERMGYKTRVVGGSHDGGIDVIAEKNGVRSLIQCKKYFNAHQVGVGAVRDFYGAIANELSNGKGYFITTSKFTLEAELFCEDKPIELVDGFKLIEYIRLADIKSS